MNTAKRAHVADLRSVCPNKRFNFIKNEDIVQLSTQKPPTTTKYSTNWGVRNFNTWRKSRNESVTTCSVPLDLLENSNIHDLNHWLSFYVVETRNCRGEKYPPKTLYQLLSGLLRYAREKNFSCPNFLDTKDPNFKQLHNTIDNIFKELRRQGIGSEEGITKEDEDRLWTSNVIDPISLL